MQNRLNVITSQKDSEISATLLDNNLIRTVLSEKGRTLMKAISIALFMTPLYDQQIQEICIRKLKHLIKTDHLPLRLTSFANNWKLFEDFQTNPSFHGFDKIFLDLTSISFEIRIIVYSISEESRLNSQIYNYKYEKNIELFRIGTHYDIIHNAKKAEIIELSREIIYNVFDEKFLVKPVIDLKVNRKESESIALDFGNFKIIDDEKNYNVPDPIIKPRHKKSFSSDNFNFNNNVNDEHNKYYNLFTNLQAPKEFHHIFSGEKKNNSLNQNSEETFKWQINKGYSEKGGIIGFGKETPKKGGALFAKFKNEENIKPFEPPFFSVNSPNFEGFTQNQDSLLFSSPNQLPDYANKLTGLVENENELRKVGRLKFFDENKNYGFIIMDEDGSDIFVHYDDLLKSGVTKELLRTAKQGIVIRFSFNCMNYIGKYNKSKKAINLTLLNPFI